jgi:hypothetical protein
MTVIEKCPKISVIASNQQLPSTAEEYLSKHSNCGMRMDRPVSERKEVATLARDPHFVSSLSIVDNKQKYLKRRK